MSKTYTEAPAIEQVTARMDTALRRIYSAAVGIMNGEEPPGETARDIMTMVLKAYGKHPATDWSHGEYPNLAPYTVTDDPQR